MKKLWIFSSYNWQGNPKALFLYMAQKYENTHDCWWISERKEELESLEKMGLKNILYMHDKKCTDIFKGCDVYVTENFRENYPVNLPLSAKIINTWHGVGLKHVELALGEDSILSDSIVRKHIKNFKKYRNQSYFLATSKAMEEHFIEDTVIEKCQILRGPYPRNIVYKEIQSFDSKKIFDKANYNHIILFAPTYRVDRINGVLHELIPNFELLELTLIKNNDLFLIKVHPFMKNDPYFEQIRQKYLNSSHILFWDDLYDIYEIFHLIDIAIIDYSSIFYDLLEANVHKFIRYIPDYKKYSNSLEFIGDYYELTGGIISESFTHLLDTLSEDIPPLENKKILLDYFFSYSERYNLDQFIQKIESLTTANVNHPQLHSFDIFDTLIRRKTLVPFSIFAFMQNKILSSDLDFPQILKDNWTQIRHKTEMDVRDMFRKTTFERKTNKIEITLDDIYTRLQNNYLLNNQQIEYLKNTEIEAEISHVEPIQHRIEYMLDLKNQGHDIILISDMYLPESVIQQMLVQADHRLANIPLYLSSSIGHQKSTGKLYKHIFFQQKYKYEKWIHYGDNAHADGVEARKFGIETRVHHMDSFIPFENRFISSAPHSFKYHAYQLATLMQRYRQDILCRSSTPNYADFEKNYYAYAYAGSILIPYIHWTILDALKRGYETLYFISRDGHYLKLIADEIIKEKKYAIQTKFIYGSRKAWRLPSFIDKIDDEMFGPFGNFIGMDSFQDLVQASYLSENELLELFPEFESLKNERHLRGSISENIRKTLSKSQQYRKKVLALAAEKRVLVELYIVQNINFNEKFAFVEFWGRGYTQDVFSRLLNKAAGKDITNPFYYCRSFSPENKLNIRHNFVLAPVNFSYFEPIFASTPYQSISEYKQSNNSIEAVIIEDLNEFYTYFEKNLVKFTQDYLSIQTENPSSFARYINEQSYMYQMSEHSDQFICNVFGELKDNISSFAETVPYAPSLSLELLETIRDKKDLDQLTRSIPISLAKSDDETRHYYQKIYKKMQLPALKTKGVQYFYPYNDLAQYVIPTHFPIKMVSADHNSIFYDISFAKNTKRTDTYFEQCEIFNVIAIEWLNNGIPRLVTEFGYVTAHKDWVVPLAKAEGIYVRKNELGVYEAIEQPKVAIKQKAIYKLINLIEKPYKLFNKDADLEHAQKKWNKFTRDPYQFFADAKNDKLVVVKYLFNENQKIGKTLSHWIRKNF